MWSRQINSRYRDKGHTARTYLGVIESLDFVKSYDFRSTYHSAGVEHGTVKSTDVVSSTRISPISSQILFSALPFSLLTLSITPSAS